MMRMMLGRFCAALFLAGIAMAALDAHAGEGSSESQSVVDVTRQTVLAYFDHLRNGSGWQSSFAEGMRFNIRTSAHKEVEGKDAYLRAAAPFYSMIRSVELRELIIDGERACALTRYELQPPNAGPAFASDVAEIIMVRNDKIVSLEIYFDTAPYPK